MRLSPILQPVLQSNSNLTMSFLISASFLNHHHFYSHEPNEPPHVHVDRDNLSAKFWLNPVSHARNFGFSARELRQIEELIRQHQTDLLEAWNGYFGIGS